MRLEAEQPRRALEILRREQTRLLWIERTADASASNAIARLDRVEHAAATYGEAAATLITALEDTSETAGPGAGPQSPAPQASSQWRPSSCVRADAGWGLELLRLEFDGLTQGIAHLLDAPSDTIRLARLERRLAHAMTTLAELYAAYQITPPLSVAPGLPAGPIRSRAPSTWPHSRSSKGQAARMGAVLHEVAPPEGRRDTVSRRHTPTDSDAANTPLRAQSRRADQPLPASWVTRQSDGRDGPFDDQDLSPRRAPILGIGILLLAAVGIGWLGALWWNGRTPAPPAAELSADGNRAASPYPPKNPTSDHTTPKPPATGEGDDKPEVSLQEIQAQQAALVRRVETLESLVRESMATSKASIAALTRYLSREEPVRVNRPTESEPSRPPEAASPGRDERSVPN